MAASAPVTLRPVRPISRLLSQLVSEFGLDMPGGAGEVEISGVTLTSNSVMPGDLFIGLAGRNIHGATYAGAAAELGAVAILTDDAGATFAADSGLPVVIVPNPREALGAVSAWIYRTAEYSAELYAVTGTNGKTSVAYLLEAILVQLGVSAGLSSTAERRIGTAIVPSTLTTPEATELHGLLARMREAGVRAAVVEVSAQALTQHRVDGLVFDVAGFTNLSHDHLDEYDEMGEYFEAKLGLFQPDRARRGVVTVDSDWGRVLATNSRIPVTTLSTSDDANAEWTMSLVSETISHTEFVLVGPQGRRLATRVPLLGWYMAANAALAIVMLVESGYDLDAIAHSLERDGGIVAFIPGRAERISGDDGPIVFIDYGHSPDAFLSTLGAIRRVTNGRIVMVFGADGDRDASKRDDMGAIAARGSDVVVITDFHPRSEEPGSIRATLIAAARRAVPDLELYEIADQRSALRKAVSLAGAGDVVLFAGPGHEIYQEVSGQKIPYSAREDARLALREAGWL